MNKARMVEFATQYEVDNFKDFELRLLTPLDALELTKAQNETYMDLANFFDEEFYSQPRPFIQTFNNLMATIRDHEIDLYGFFNGRKLIGVGSYHYIPYSDYGCQIVIWMRSSESKKKIGAYFLKRLTLHAIYGKKFRFIELLIDQNNIPSRSIASNVGYEHIHDFEGDTYGKKASGVYCRYVCFDPVIDSISESFRIGKMDLINHPGYLEEYRNLLNYQQVNEEYKWPYPVLEQKNTVIDKPLKRDRSKSKNYKMVLSNAKVG